MEGKKVLILLLLLLGGLTMELITGTMATANNTIRKASPEDGGGLEVMSNQVPSISSPPPHHHYRRPSPLPPSPPPAAASSAGESASALSASGNGDSLVCWSCSSSSHGNPCYNIDPENATAVDSKACAPEEIFCSVKHIWYVVESTEKKKENVNFSVNRTCATECNPTCMVIGDRTKIHSCTSCCTESLCNTDISSSSKQTSSITLLMSAFIVALAPMLSISLLTSETNAQDGNSSISNRNSSISDRNSSNSTSDSSSSSSSSSSNIISTSTSTSKVKATLGPTTATATFSKVFLSPYYNSHQMKDECQQKLGWAKEYTSKSSAALLQTLFPFVPSTLLHLVYTSLASKSFDNF